MTEISRAALFGKLNPIAYKAIEGATVFCKLRGNPYVELVHWLHQILQVQDSDLHRIVRHFELDPSRLAADVTAALDRLPRGATSISDLSPQIDEAVERGWVFATLMFGETQVRTGHLRAGLPEDADAAQRAQCDQPAVRAGEGRGADRRFRHASWPARRRPRWPPPTARRGRRRRARRAARWRRRRWASRRRCSSSRST